MNRLLGMGLALWLGMGLISPAWGQAVKIDDLLPGVVKVIAKPEQGEEQTGTGFIVQVKHNVVYILTAAHVVEGVPNPMVEFSLPQRPSSQAKVMEGAELWDRYRGLALLKMTQNIPDSVKALVLAAPKAEVPLGQEVRVLGYPGGSLSVVRGSLVSRSGRSIKLDVNVVEGASGGPVLSGRVVVGLVQTVAKPYPAGNSAGSLRAFLEGYEELGALPKGFGSGSASTSIMPSTSTSTAREPETQKMTTSQLPKTKKGQDGAPMVLVPAGLFTMGSNDGEEDEKPPHEVELDAFYIDKYEVTTSRYGKFLQATGRKKPGYWTDTVPVTYGDRPVVGVTWHDAKAYCEKYGKRLPTEAEWEKAARGKDGRKYPWGNSMPNSNLANFDGDLSSPIGKTEELYSARLTPVGSYESGKSPYGVYDMAGNVWEWVADWYGKDYYTNSPRKNPKGPSSGELKVLRGGSWHFSAYLIRSAFRNRNTPGNWLNYNGVRCAKTP